MNQKEKTEMKRRVKKFRLYKKTGLFLFIYNFLISGQISIVSY